VDLRLWSLLLIALVELFVIGLFVQLFPFLVRLTRQVPLPANLGLQLSCGVSFPTSRVERPTQDEPVLWVGWNILACCAAVSLEANSARGRTKRAVDTGLH
jgi:hypothetical protein